MRSVTYVPWGWKEEGVPLPIPAYDPLARFRTAAEAFMRRVAEKPGQWS